MIHFKRIFLLLALIFTLNAFAEEAMLHETPYSIIQKSMGKGKPNFIEVGSDSCYSCQVMGKMLYKVAKKHPSYNINFVNVKKERKVAHKLQIRMIPTQIIFDKDGKEVYRHIGVLSPDALNTLFGTYKFDLQSNR